jgi:hypothetical protein
MSHGTQQTGLPSGLSEEKPKSMIKCKTSLLILQLMMLFSRFTKVETVAEAGPPVPDATELTGFSFVPALGAVE